MHDTSQKNATLGPPPPHGGNAGASPGLSPQRPSGHRANVRAGRPATAQSNALAGHGMGATESETESTTDHRHNPAPSAAWSVSAAHRLCAPPVAHFRSSRPQQEAQRDTPKRSTHHRRRRPIGSGSASGHSRDIGSRARGPDSSNSGGVCRIAAPISTSGWTRGFAARPRTPSVAALTQIPRRGPQCRRGPARMACTPLALPGPRADVPVLRVPGSVRIPSS